MKKITLTSIFLVCFLSLFGQTIDLSFTALDSTVYVQLDSVKVMNRTQGTETMLIWPDTTLSLEIDMGDLLLYVGFISFSPVGEQEISTERRPFELFQNYPNPVSDESSISLNIPERGTVNVAVSDLQGRQAFFADWNLEEGIHSFRFIPGNSSMYFLTARWNGMSRSIKILAAGSGNRQRCQVEYKGGSSEGSFLKASTQTRYVVMESGIVDMPETSTSYIFQFARNIPCPGTPSVTYEGHVYQTIQVFSQCWLKENLNVGTMISGTSEQLNNGTIEKYCYGDVESNCGTYGGLYQWNETMHYNTEHFAKGICPPGWHLPMDEEWKVLEGAMDNQYGFGDPEWDGEGYRGNNAGSTLKEAGTIHWDPPNWGATNSSGFTGLPGGYRDFGAGGFTAIGSGGSFWTSTHDGTGSAWYRALNYASPHVYRNYIERITGYSVRCLRGCVPLQAYAGEDGTGCGIEAFPLSGASAMNYASLSWATSGTGTFDDPVMLNPVYTPSQEDLAGGQVVLTLTASGGGECTDAVSAMTLTLSYPPEVNAGEDADICSTQSFYALNGTANNFSSVSWTTSGSGTFNDPTSLTSSYLPSSADKMMGQVILSLTAVGNGPCDPVSDGLVLRIWTGIANAGPDQMNVHGNYTTLQGNEPTFGNGLWQIVTGSGGNIDDPDNPVSGFHGVIDHTYSLTWTISNALCATSVDTVVIRFVPLWSCGEPIVDDRDGQSYNTALIGEQCWLAENMNIGTMIISSGPGQLQTDNGIFEKYCYDNIPVNCDIYGGLYEWREAMQYTTDRSPQGICPEGWHFASDAEWKTLEGTVDSQFGVGNPEWDDIGWRGDDAGANLKETGTVHWLSPNNATNMSGFTALGCGSRDEEGTFDYIQFLGMFHTSTQSGESTNITRGMRHDHTGVHRYDLYDVNAGRGVRCLKSE